MAKKYKAKYSGKVFNTEEEAAKDNARYLKDVRYRYLVKGDNLGHPLEYAIPFISDKRITLSNAGLATGAVLSENMLDSIAKYATLAGLPIKTAIGLAVKESTLGNPTDDTSIYLLLSPENEAQFRKWGTGQHINTEGLDILPRNLLNFYVDERNTYEATQDYVDRKAEGNEDKALLMLIEGEKYADKLALNYADTYVNNNVMYNAFKFYKEHPNSYNSKLPNYQLLVNRRANETWKSPEILSWYLNYQNTHEDGGPLHPDWSELSIKERAAYIRMGVASGYKDIDSIKLVYNEFRNGGNKKYNYTPSDYIKNRISTWEGAAMDRDTIDPLTGKVAKKNASFDTVSRYFINAIPEDIRELVLSNQALADHLYSYAYNVGPQRFAERVVPALLRYYNGNGSIDDITLSMWASGDAKLRGLQLRRNAEREGVRNALSTVPTSIGDNKVVYFTNPFLSVDSNPQGVLILSTVSPEEILLNVNIPKAINIDDDIQAAVELPEVQVIGHQPKVNPFTILSLIQESSPIPLTLEPYLIPNIQDKFKEIAEENNSFLQKDLEDRILAEERRRKLGYSYKDDTWEGDIYDNQFRRNMAANGGNLFSGEENHSLQMVTSGRKLEYHPEEDYYYGGIPFKITVTGKNKKKRPYWVSPKGAGNMTVMPGDPEIVFFAPIAAGAAITAAPAIGSVLGNTMTGINAAGDALAATAAGQRLTSGLNFVANAVGSSKAWPWIDAGLTSAFAGHGLNHAINESIDGWGDAAMTALEIAPLGRLARPMWNAGKEGVQYAAKVADNTARYVSPSYDLYRTIGETTPRTTPRLHSFYTSDLTGGALNEHVYTGSPIFEFGQTIRTSPEKAYFMRAPKDIDILKLENGQFRHEVVGNEILPSGEVNGKFVSYGEPWKEFALGENSALYEFPVGPRRGPSLMATDWKGRPQKYSVDEIYDYMQKEKALNEGFRKDVTELGLDKLKGAERVEAYRALKGEKYPELLEDYDTSIHGANQTIIPNERWNFDKFLKTPFWKYSENPISGQVQKELMMRWPEAKPLETPTTEWTDATSMTQKVNWDADNWFKTISGRSSYSSEEAAELASHVPEYRAIEQRLFNEGKLALDSNGNIIVVGSEMSPQEYIMRQSAAFQKMNPEHHYVGVSKSLRHNFENEARDPNTINRYEVWTDRKSPKNVEEYAQSQQGGYTNDSQIETIEHQIAIREENYDLHKEQLKWKLDHGKISQENYDRDLAALEDMYNWKQKDAEDELKVLRQQKALDPLNGGKVFDVTYPKETAETPIINAENSHWARIPFDNVVRDAPSVVTHYKQRPYSNELQTDQIVSAARRNGYGATHIDNVMDTYDGTMLNETIIGRDTPIKSVLGNTGTFDIESPNKWRLYRSLLPPFLTLGTLGTMYETNQKTLGGKIKKRRR